jgi:acyl carrier protein
MTNSADSPDVETMVKEFLAGRFDIPEDKMTADASLRDLGLDSIVMLDVMLDIEDRLGIKLKDLSMPANPRLHDIVELIQRNLAVKT